MKSSGTKTELICRLQSVKEEVVLEAIAEVLQGTDGPEEDADDVEQLSSKVGQLQGIVGQLSQEIGTLRTTVAENISLMMDTNEIVSSSSQSTPMITSNINTCPLASYVPTMPTITTTTQNAHQGNLYSQVNYDSLATNMYARSTFPSPAAQNVFLPSPHYMVSQQQPMVSSRVYPHMVQSPAATMPSTTKQLLAALQDDTSVVMNKRRDEAIKYIEEARVKWKSRFDAKHNKPIKYNEGDLVLIESPLPSTGDSRKLQAKYKGPYVVTKALRYDRYVIEDVEGMKRTSHRYSSVAASDKMKPFCALFPEIDECDDDDNDDADQD